MANPLLSAVVIVAALRRRRTPTPTGNTTPPAAPTTPPPAPAQTARRIRPGAVAVGIAAGALALAVAGGAGWVAARTAVHTPTVITAVAGTPMNTETLWNTSHNAVATLTTPNGTVGTGFLLPDRSLLTAAHTLADDPTVRAALTAGDNPTVTVTFGDGHVTAATITDSDNRADIAVLHLNNPPDTAALPWAGTLAPVGSPAAIIGAGATNSTLTITSGIISAHLTGGKWNAAGREDATTVTDAAVNAGDSGAPVLDSAGRVIAMVVARPDTLDARPTENFATTTPTPVLAGALARLGTGNGPARLGVTVNNSTGGPVVQGTGAGASTSPLHAGDIITSVDGTATPTVADLLATLDQVSANTVNVAVNRDGQPHTYTVDVLRINNPAR